MRAENIALYWEKSVANHVTCLLCPHACTLKPSQAGLCRVRVNRDGVLYTANYAKIISYGYDPVEKKPIRHFMPGSMVFSIGTFGCNFGCTFCQNHELVYFEGDSDGMSDDQVIRMAERQGSIGIAYTYNEPTVWYEYVLHLCQLAHARGLKNILVTNGFINEAPLRQLLPYIDAMNIDLKAMHEGFYKAYCKGSLEPVMKTIAIAAQHTHVEVSHLMIDTLNADLEETEALSRFLASIDPEFPLHLSRYFPNHQMDLPMTQASTLRRAAVVARKHLKHVYIGNISYAELEGLEEL